MLIHQLHLVVALYLVRYSTLGWLFYMSLATLHVVGYSACGWLLCMWLATLHVVGYSACGWLRLNAETLNLLKKRRCGREIFQIKEHKTSNYDVPFTQVTINDYPFVQGQSDVGQMVPVERFPSKLEDRRIVKGKIVRDLSKKKTNEPIRCDKERILLNASRNRNKKS
ncbi:hypothetical protein TNCV_2745101 [Trichonephila clavipes]|nr:hypothetical protein TNCV_2745101 [Trichonephila clavipes]